VGDGAGAGRRGDGGLGTGDSGDRGVGLIGLVIQAQIAGQTV